MDPHVIEVARDGGSHRLLSSHLMSEMALTADRLIIVGRGRLIAQTTVKEFSVPARGTSFGSALRRPPRSRHFSRRAVARWCGSATTR